MQYAMLETLVVEDQEEVRAAIAIALQDAGHHVTEAEDGELAMKFIAAQRFDLIICDLHLPKLDGQTLLRRVNVLSPRTRVIVMTSCGQLDDVIGAMRSGAVDFMSKPFDPDVLVDRISRAIGPPNSRRSNA
jgi:DNA-binding NtrC family response regulator